MEKLFLEMKEITNEIGEISASTSRAMLNELKDKMEARYIVIYNNCSDN